MAEQDSDRKVGSVLGNIDPVPAAREHRGDERHSVETDDDDTPSTGGDGAKHPGARDVSEGGGVGTEVGGTRNYHEGSGVTGGDLGNRPE